MRIRTIFSNIVWILTYFIYWPLVRIFYSVKIKIDSSVLKEATKPIIIISNHQSLLDPWHVNVALPFRIFFNLLPIRMYAAAQRLKDPTSSKLKNFGIMGLVYFLCDVIVIPNDGTYVEKIMPLIDALKRSETAFVFPEGGMSTDGIVKDFKRGAAELCYRTRNKILPVAIRFYSGKIRKRCSINFGKVFQIPDELLSIVEVDERHRVCSEYLRKIILQLYNET